jgi:DNA-directed RNA polymerase sigma subunit (sigma70/sigma32)
VRIPMWRSQRLRKLARLNEALSAELGRTATADELGERLGLTPEQMAELEGDRLEVVSLDTPLDASDADSRTVGDTFHDESVIDPATKLSREELTEEIMACLHELDDRELEILSRKHGFHPQGQLSFRELGRRLNLSHEWVRRIAELAVVKVRRALDLGRGLPKGERQRLRDRVLARLQRLALPSGGAGAAV